MIRPNRRLTIPEISKALNVSFGSVKLVLTKNSDMRRVRSLFHNCWHENNRNSACRYRWNCVIMWIQIKFFSLSSLITGDESRVYDYDPEIKTQISHWQIPKLPRWKKARQLKSNVKVMLIFFSILKELWEFVVLTTQHPHSKRRIGHRETQNRRPGPHIKYPPCTCMCERARVLTSASLATLLEWICFNLNSSPAPHSNQTFPCKYVDHHSLK
jgi:hypothetical protein